MSSWQWLTASDSRANARIWAALLTCAALAGCSTHADTPRTTTPTTSPTTAPTAEGDVRFPNDECLSSGAAKRDEEAASMLNKYVVEKIAFLNPQGIFISTGCTTPVMAKIATPVLSNPLLSMHSEADLKGNPLFHVVADNSGVIGTVYVADQRVPAERGKPSAREMATVMLAQGYAAADTVTEEVDPNGHFVFLEMEKQMAEVLGKQPSDLQIAGYFTLASLDMGLTEHPEHLAWGLTIASQVAGLTGLSEQTVETLTQRGAAQRVQEYLSNTLSDPETDTSQPAIAAVQVSARSQGQDLASAIPAPRSLPQARQRPGRGLELTATTVRA